ncbi:bifunctional 2-polyprenyl-6-hydroxyphenol methylase/3-demethylubiquinol 3-O-methyltransferase UbiG [Marivibrio halodurans]|uniref:Ubiquinone biosynthesis O-methyltransferase n=1 Tax=Marivibrio halodurans TaxID=2039722 RepID=A0A8J7RXT9_9PROT|nr:bifunctional 2-polyprenyl-6-hydroxyphenol methylase/3-demethylubiquinol 3-O-methyltransferase UbiG [Marivibrio halodurans]MBP5856390.1 bifunctional 2-polyprenyl-6-hydroxyphenol methylase/3-demethylubiquinol 3-O-methyltransferase UbiG [Marivibrio halodurans]
MPIRGQAAAAGSIDAGEVEKFARIARQWWDPEGDFRPLHRLNPLRLTFLRDHLVTRFGRDPGSLTPLSGLRILDVGCGGGLVTEPLARMGADVVGLDATEESIAVARLHAEETGLAIDYRHDTAEALAAAGERFDAVLALEVVEHVNDPAAFIRTCASMVRPGGAMGLSTLNRSPKGFLLGVVAAEYVMRWLPRGTHDWRKFVKPSELAAMLRAGGLTLSDLKGLTYDPVKDAFRLDARDLAVNYLAFAVRR